MTILARLRVGRILLHLLAMLGDRCIRFHVAGIIRELPRLASALMLLGRIRIRLAGALVPYIALPIKHYSLVTTADAQSLAAIAQEQPPASVS